LKEGNLVLSLKRKKAYKAAGEKKKGTAKINGGKQSGCLRREEEGAIR